MRHHITSKVFFLFLFMGLYFCGSAQSEITIIANESVPKQKISNYEISNIYGAKIVKWSNGDKIVVTMYKKGAVHENFSDLILGTTPARLKGVWKKVIFTGSGNPPKIFKTEADLVAFVKETKGAIGYIDGNTPHEGVKLLDLK